MSLDSDIREIKSALSENKRNFADILREIQEIKRDLKKIQDSSSDDFFRVVKGSALVAAIAKISSISDSINKIERKL